MLASTALGNVALRRAAPRPGGEGAVLNRSMAFAVEVFAWGERPPHPTRCSPAGLRSRATRSARLWHARADREQLEVGRAALDEILRVEGAKG